MLAPCSAAVHAGIALGATLSSQTVARGVPLSDGGPTVQASADWDGADGAYAGVHAAPGLSLAGNAGVTELSAYGGLARRLANGASVDAGVIRHQFRGAGAYSYSELYTGIAFDRLSARLSWSPAYYGEGGHTLYAETNGFRPLGERFKLLAHLGWLHGLAGAAAQQRDRLDTRLALSFDQGDWNVQLAWLARRRIGAGATDRLPAPRALALSASVAF
ncbi:MAG: TorF family putative porin [Massilia sp.]